MTQSIFLQSRWEFRTQWSQGSRPVVLKWLNRYARSMLRRPTLKRTRVRKRSLRGERDRLLLARFLGDSSSSFTGLRFQYVSFSFAGPRKFHKHMNCIAMTVLCRICMYCHCCVVHCQHREKTSMVLAVSGLRVQLSNVCFRVSTASSGASSPWLVRSHR